MILKQDLLKTFTTAWRKANRNYIYVMWSWRFFWAAKIGVSDTPMRRLAEVNTELSEERGYNVELCIVPIPVPFAAYTFESVLHNAKPFCYLKYRRIKKATGRTEWFWCCNPFFTALFCIWCYYSDAPMYQWSVVFLLPTLPLDAILISAVFVLSQWAAVFGFIYFILKTLLIL